MFKNPFSFKGRIRRYEYGLSYIIYVISFIIISLASHSESNLVIPKSNIAIIQLLFYIPLLWFFWAQGAKRCHDRGNSGWYQIIPFYCFWMLFADSLPVVNKYGQNPKKIGIKDEIDEIGSLSV